MTDQSSELVSRTREFAERAKRLTQIYSEPGNSASRAPRIRRLYGAPALGIPEVRSKPRPAKKHQSSIIKRVLRAAVRAGFEPSGFRVGDNGEVTVFTKKATAEAAVPSSSSEDVNEWDEVNGAD
jgi:hypothetical protein